MTFSFLTGVFFSLDLFIIIAPSYDLGEYIFAVIESVELILVSNNLGYL